MDERDNVKLQVDALYSEISGIKNTCSEAEGKGLNPAQVEALWAKCHHIIWSRKSSESTVSRINEKQKHSCCGFPTGHDGLCCECKNCKLVS